MGEYAAFLLILVFGFACGYGTARARGEKKAEPGTLPEPTSPAPPMPEVKVVAQRFDEGSPSLMDWPGWEYTKHPERFAPRNEVVRSDYMRRKEEGSIPTGMQYEHFVAMLKYSIDIAPSRRRDDNRAQRAPEEPWQ